MARYKLLIEYDGGPFVGWQRQDNGPSVQGAIEDAAFAFCAVKTTAAAAGRTDAGVHALAMSAHIDLDDAPPADTVRDALNHHLKPLPIAVIDAAKVEDDFHARFSATARHYQYRIVNRRAPLTLEAGRAWRVAGELDENAMNEAAARLVGMHDFSTFRAAQCQAKSPMKTLTALCARREGQRLFIEASAPSFLHSQVRSLAGTLVQVGLGRWSADDVDYALRARNRAACGPVAPAEGLYFVRADYEKSL